MSTKFGNSGISQDSFGGRGERTVTDESYVIDRKRADAREHWAERIEYRCTVINSKGLPTKCRKPCSECAYYLGRKSNRLSIDDLRDSYGFEFPSDDPTPDEAYRQKELEEKLAEAIGSLPTAELRDVANLVWEERTIREIAAILGIPTTTAFDRWKKARRLLRERLQSYWDSIH